MLCFYIHFDKGLNLRKIFANNIIIQPIKFLGNMLFKSRFVKIFNKYI